MFKNNQKINNWTKKVTLPLYRNKKLLEIKKKKFTILEELGRNSFAGRVTLKAKDSNDQIVVIKKFQFISNSWDGYKLVQKEIATLSNLNHPNIPKYLGQYEDNEGFCLVQEYINAPSLASYGQLPIEEVTEIAFSILDILIYLQELSPSVFHRDIKPENILYNRETKEVHLVDFGLAKIGTGTTTTSTVNGGTLGFMPPEQLLGKRLNKSSDLYSLGLTLICLLGGIQSGDLNQFINDEFEINFRTILPKKVTQQFINYLKKLVNRSYEQRFRNALTAKNELENLNKISLKKSEKLNDFDFIHWLVDQAQEEWFTPVYFTVSIILVVSWLALLFHSEYKENENLKQNLILMTYQNQKLLMSEYELKEIKGLVSHQKITLFCGENNFYFTNKSSFEYKHIQELPEDSQSISCLIYQKY